MRKSLWFLFFLPLLAFRTGTNPVHKAPLHVDVNKVFLLVDKSAYKLYVYEDVTLIRTYDVVFGSGDLSDKEMQGDKRTPIGTFHIIAKKYDNRWSRFLLLDYPNQESIEKFEERKSEGKIPHWAHIGDGIGIHGVWPKIEYYVFRYRMNWTDGCISLRNEDIDELYDLVKVGTPVIIRE
ncbi:MAG TPA: L,D-transpeptidase [Chitinophagaceae bacterium]|nr:L,D-transpeptidase [Chitinophagaceae bacterium]